MNSTDEVINAYMEIKNIKQLYDEPDDHNLVEPAQNLIQKDKVAYH